MTLEQSLDVSSRAMRAVSSLRLDFFNWCLLGVVAAVLAFQLAVPPLKAPFFRTL